MSRARLRAKAGLVTVSCVCVSLSACKYHVYGRIKEMETLNEDQEEDCKISLSVI